MGSCVSRENAHNECTLHNVKHAKRPNGKKQYENIVYDYLFNKYKILPQKELYDFILVDYDIYIEVDEEQHMGSGKSKKKEEQTRRDNDKIKKCLSKPNATLVRIAWFSIRNGEYIDIIEQCVKNKKKYENKLVLSSREIYENLDMLKGIDNNVIIYYK